MVTNGVELDGLRDGTREGNATYDLVHFNVLRRLDFIVWGAGFTWGLAC